MRIALYARRLDPRIHAIIHRLQELLPEAAFIFHRHLTVEPDVRSFADADTLASHRPDLLLAIGGDGTLLDTVALVRHRNIPVLGINLGKLGFLAAVSPEALPLLAEEIRRRTYVVHPRMMLHVLRPGDVFSYPTALNDVVIKDAEPHMLLAAKVIVDGEVLGVYHGDGVIISTPTGSTAYSLSCGGTIVYPQSPTIQVTPVAAHNLTLRPVILPCDAEISVEVTSRRHHYLLSLDNRHAVVPDSRRLTIRKADHTFPLATLSSWNYLNTLRSKLHWASEKRNNK